MMIYHKFARLWQWPPEVVRRLRRSELYWLPLIEEASSAAAEKLAKVKELAATRRGAASGSYFVALM